MYVCHHVLWKHGWEGVMRVLGCPVLSVVVSLPLWLSLGLVTVAVVPCSLHSFLVETVCMCLRSHWSQFGFQGGPQLPGASLYPFILVIQIGFFSSWYSFTFRVWCCSCFCSCFQGSTTMCTSSAVSDFLVTWWEMQELNFKWLEGAGKSFHLTALLAEGSAACTPQNLLSVSCSGLASHPFQCGCLTVGGRYEFSSLWLITWPVFFQLLLACAALIMGLFLAAAGETLQLTQAPSISPDLPSWFLSASEFSRNPLSCSLRAYCECQCAGH